MTKTQIGTGVWCGRLVAAGALLVGCAEIREHDDGEPDASPGNNVQDGGTDDGGDGHLSCDDRHDRAMEATMAGLARNNACSRDEECIALQKDHGCQGTCGYAINAAQQAAFEQDLSAIDAQYCATYIADGCSYATPDCALNFPICDEGKCGFAYDVQEGCATPADSVLTGAGRSFGKCAGACEFNLSIGAGTASCDEVELLTYQNGGPDPSRSYGQLTSEGLFSARRLAKRLEGVDLQATYGCPDCGDEGASGVVLRRQGVESSHAYSFMQPPAELAEADSFLQGLIDSLRSCQSSDMVVPDGDCVAQP